MSGRAARGGVRRRLSSARLPVLLVLMVLSGAGGAQAWGQDGRSDVVITDARVSESSALALAPEDPNLLYTVNDSGHDPIVFVVDRTTGDVVGTTTLEGLDVETLDTEALAVEDDTLWVGDTGDNGHERDDVALYALPAPAAGEHSVKPTAYPVQYADEPHDVEALLVAPEGAGMWLVTKGVFGGEVLALPGDLEPGEVITPDPVDGVSVPGLVTDATVLPDGEAAVVRTYGKALVYRLPSWSQVATIDLPQQQQGESITSLTDGTTLLAGSEGSPALIDEVPLPQAVVAELAEDEGPADGPVAESSDSDEPGGSPNALAWTVVGGIVVLVVGGALFTGRRRAPQHYR